MTASPRLVAALLRHGDYHQLPDTPSAHQPFPLTPLGREQAGNAGEEIAAMLDAQGWRLAPAIDSSNLLRAWQTADLLHEAFRGGVPAVSVQGYDALAERGLGSAANLTATQIEAIIAEDPRFAPLPMNWKADSHYRLPLQGAESLMEAGERVAAHLSVQMQALADSSRSDQSPGGTQRSGLLKLFVGHGAAFRHAAHRLGVLAFDDIAKLSMHHARPVYLEYLPGQGFRHIAGEWKVRGRHSHYRD